MATLEEAVEAARKLMDIPGVEGVGQGKLGQADCIVVFVSARTPELERQIPRDIAGFPVDILESGVIQAQPTSPPLE